MPVDRCAETNYKSAPKLQPLVYDILPWRKVPESDAHSVERPFSGVTNSGKIWRKVPEESAGKRCSESGVPLLWCDQF